MKEWRDRKASTGEGERKAVARGVRGGFCLLRQKKVPETVLLPDRSLKSGKSESTLYEHRKD